MDVWFFSRHGTPASKILTTSEVTFQKVVYPGIRQPKMALIIQVKGFILNCPEFLHMDL